MKKKIAIISIIFSVLVGTGIIVSKFLPKGEDDVRDTKIDVESAYAEVEPPEGDGPGFSEEELAFIAEKLAEQFPDITEPYDVLEITPHKAIIVKDGQELEVTY